MMWAVVSDDDEHLQYESVPIKHSSISWFKSTEYWIQVISFHEQEAH